KFQIRGCKNGFFHLKIDTNPSKAGRKSLFSGRKRLRGFESIYQKRMKHPLKSEPPGFGQQRMFLRFP
ncbi:MAG: hypothetical protein IJK54_03080, partial [Clostridia bacterium]|nr:hypothetical protein [Clostridia bacterium]